MALPKRQPETTSFNQVLKLVGTFSQKERAKLRKELQLEELRYEIQKGIDAADRGELIPAEQVFAELKQRIAERKKGNRKKQCASK